MPTSVTRPIRTGPDASSIAIGRRGLVGAALGGAASALAALPLAPRAAAQAAAPASPVAAADPAAIDPRFAHHTTTANGVRLHYVRGGQGEPLVLLHGYTQTWYEWRKVLPALADRFDVIAPDLRGAGDSDRPAGGYDKRTMAEDIRALLDGLGIDRIRLVGHDIGLMVAYAFAAAYPDRVGQLVLLDAPLPGVGPWDALAPQVWHFAFHAVSDLPEALTAGREREYLSWFWRAYAYDPSAIGPADADEYVRAYAAPGGMRAGFDWFRAFPQDAADNLESARTPLPMPVLALGGAAGTGEVSLQSARAVATDVSGGVIDHCGHWIAEERPDELVARLLAFFGEG
jgi:pimeloyl-ACP methyl ester carboxylesterase